VSLNGRNPKKLVSSDLDLGKIPKFQSAFYWVEN
jgi:hypothetical protein